VRQIGQTVQERFSSHPSIIEDLKKRARELGLWNMFLPKAHFKEGAGFSNLEYGLMAEYLGKSRTASEAVNCAAPDTGNMEVIAKYGTEAQKREWLDPLLEGKIRSAFLMTEPQVASSDATNIEMTIKKDGDHYVLNGQVISPCSQLIFHVTNSLLEMVVIRHWRPSLQDLHCPRKDRPQQPGQVQAAICHSCTQHHPRCHHPPHVVSHGFRRRTPRPRPRDV
jgi:hypothetical protein